jgi:hypothetical protein
MTLLHVPLDQIDQSQLQRLIDGRAVETRDIEYKRQSYGNADKDHGEFLADVSSFANTSGGDIVIGMTAQSGIPTGFNPIAIETADTEILRLESIARSGLQPRVFGLDFRSVPANGGAVIVVRVPRSYNPPHRIIRHGSGQHRFFARSSAGKYEPNVDELRSLFTRAPQLSERIRDFRFDRVAKLAAADGPVKLQGRDAIVMHVVPFSAFDTRLALPLDPESALYTSFPPLGSAYPQNYRINLDGLLTLSNVEERAPSQRAYTQLFHSGVVEAAASLLFGDGTDRNPRRASSIQTEMPIVRWSHVYLRQLIKLGCEPPFAVLVSFIGVKGAPYSFTPIAGGGFEFDHERGILDRDQFHFSEVIVENIPEEPYEYAKRLRPLFDEIANAAGRASTVSFDHQGNFRYSIR